MKESMCNMRKVWLIALVFGVVFPMPASALINPNFTPIHLVEQSETVLELTFGQERDDDGMVRAVVETVIKGDIEKESFRIDPAAAISVAQQDQFVNAVGRDGQRAMLFIGEFEPGGFEGGDLDIGLDAMERPKSIGFLHIDGLPAAQWLILENWEEDIWDMLQSEAFLLATYNGGTDMLRRMVDYILSDPGADVPVDSGIRWETPPTKIGKVDGTVTDAAAVRVYPNESPAMELFLAGPDGDRLFRWKEGEPVDITEETGLNSRSEVFAWADFNGNGRMDLASFDGESITLHYQQEDGSFAANALELGDGALEHGCLSLSPIEIGNDAAGLIAGTRRVPVLISFEGGEASWRPLVDEPDEVDSLEDPSVSIVADFDGNGRPDVLQLGASASHLYRGIGTGRFADPVRTNASVGGGEHGVTLGDFDQGGLPDLFVAAERRHLLWQNRGDGVFEETMMLSGEVSYKLTSEGKDAHTADFGNDGREDLMITYSSSQAPYILYNRGFRSFAHALNLDLDRDNLLPQTTEGQQAACFGDFTGNGAVDLAIVLNDGEIWWVRREMDRPAALTIQAILPEGESGPVSVKGTRFERELGMRRATPANPAVFGARRPGPVTITWQYPDGEPQQKEVILEDRPVSVLLEP